MGLKWISKNDRPEAKMKLRGEQKRKLLRCFHRKERPLLIGELAMWVGLHLELTNELLEEMVGEAILRHPTADEIKAKGSLIRDRYVLLGPISAKLAGDDA